MIIPGYKLQILLKDALDSGDLTSLIISRCLNVHTSNISDWIRAKSFPRDANIEQLAELLHVEYVELKKDVARARRGKRALNSDDNKTGYYIEHCQFWNPDEGIRECQHCGYLERHITELYQQINNKPIGKGTQNKMYKEVDISVIKVGKRIREDVGNIDELAESIRDLGLINPVTLTEDFELIAGQRRLEACKQLGWEKIPAMIKNVEEVSA